MKMNRDDLMSATLAWIFGELYQICAPGGPYFSQLSTDNRFDPEKFHDFCLRTHNVVWRYLQGSKELDGTCSDMECTMALKAKRVFHEHIVQDIWGYHICVAVPGLFADKVKAPYNAKILYYTGGIDTGDYVRYFSVDQKEAYNLPNLDEAMKCMDKLRDDVECYPLGMNIADQLARWVEQEKMSKGYEKNCSMYIQPMKAAEHIATLKLREKVKQGA